MEEKLLECIYKYGFQRKSTDAARDFIYEFIEIILHYKNLYSYVQDIKIKKFLVLENKEGKKTVEKNCFAKYDVREREIFVYLESIKQYVKKEQNKLLYFNKIEENIYFYVKLAFILLHELDHAEKERDKNDIRLKNFEVTLLRICDAHERATVSYQIKKNKDIEKYLELSATLKKASLRVYQNYKRKYMYAPDERLANFYASSQLLKILSSDKKYIPNLMQIELLEKIRSQLESYQRERKIGRIYQKRYFSPTITYLQGENDEKQDAFDHYKNDFMQNIYACKHNFSLEDRIKYGLCISQLELEKEAQKLR